MAIVYLHKKKETNEVFYVGIGRDEKRAYSKHGRNIHWKSIVSKYDFDVEITHKNICWEEACKIEIYLISFYRLLFKLSNVTDGGEGMLNVKFPDYIIKKRNEKIKGAWNEERKKKYSYIFSGENNPYYGKKHTEEVRKKMSENNNPRKNISEEHKKRISKSNKGKVRTEEVKKRLSAIKKGKPAHNKGKTVSEATKNKIRNSLLKFHNKQNL